MENTATVSYIAESDEALAELMTESIANQLAALSKLKSQIAEQKRWDAFIQYCRTGSFE